MPRPSARFSRITGALRILCAALWLAACGGGGGSGGGTAAPTASTPSTGGQSSSVTLAWNAATGPVKGYSVYVQRNDGDFKHEADVPQTRATVYGVPGSRARVIVVAFDAARTHGPISPSSLQFTFPAAKASAAGASAAGFVGTAAASVPVAVASQSASVLASAETSGETPTPDLPGGALVWQAGDAFRLTNAAVETARIFARPAGAQLVGVADFDADGQGDLLWQTATSQLAYTPGHVLRGADPVSLIDLGTLAAGEQVIGAGDFDGDRRGDVLVSAAGVIHARLTAPGGAPAIADLGSAAQAALAGIADFDANGSDDLAWRTSDALVLWLMDGGGASASVRVDLAIGSDVIGIGDFDGDGAAEVATRSPDGQVFVFHPLREPEPTIEATDLENALGWTGVGAVDFELDRSEELVLFTAEAIRYAGLPGEQGVALDPESPWQLVALLP